MGCTTEKKSADSPLQSAKDYRDSLMDGRKDYQIHRDIKLWEMRLQLM